MLLSRSGGGEFAFRTAAPASRVVHWQDHSERGARADFAFELDPPLEQLNKTAHDCETESGTAFPTRASDVCVEIGPPKRRNFAAVLLRETCAHDLELRLGI